MTDWVKLVGKMISERTTTPTIWNCKAKKKRISKHGIANKSSKRCWKYQTKCLYLIRFSRHLFTSQSLTEAFCYDRSGTCSTTAKKKIKTTKLTTTYTYACQRWTLISFQLYWQNCISAMFAVIHDEIYIFLQFFFLRFYFVLQNLDLVCCC